MLAAKALPLISLTAALLMAASLLPTRPDRPGPLPTTLADAPPHYLEHPAETGCLLYLQTRRYIVAVYPGAIHCVYDRQGRPIAWALSKAQLRQHFPGVYDILYHRVISDNLTPASHPAATHGAC